MDNKILQYVINNYLLNHNVDRNYLDIDFSVNGSGKIRITDNTGGFFSDHTNKLEDDNLVWDQWDGEDIPFLFSKQKSDEVITVNEDGSVTINYDIIGSIFYFLSGWQELDIQNADEYGRFPYKNSFQFRFNLIELPVVNYYYSILSKAICLAYGLDTIQPKLKDQNFVTFVSHDIDICRSGWLQDAFNQIKAKKFFSAGKIMLNRLVKKDQWFNFERILNFEKKKNIFSTFFFIPRRGKHAKSGVENADYDINNKEFVDVFKNIRKHGSEVGLHGSLGSGLDKHHMKADFDNFPSKTIGNRYHFLMYRIDLIPEILEQSSIKYDNSVYFAEHIGFRHATCTPFFLYDYSKDEMSQVIEIPLTIMDGTLEHKKYMGIPKNEMLEVCKKTIDETHKFNGILSVLWHNNYYSDFKYTGWEGVLEEILAYAEEKKTCYMSGEQIMEVINEN